MDATVVGTEFRVDRKTYAPKPRRAVRIGAVETALVQLDLQYLRKSFVLYGEGSDNDVPLIQLVFEEDAGEDEPAIATVNFPEFKGWVIWSAEVRKDYVAICFWKQS